MKNNNKTGIQINKSGVSEHIDTIRYIDRLRTYSIDALSIKE